MTTVVNIKKEKCDVYIGRGSPFGNPYKIGWDGTRKDVIEKYREWFKKRLTNPEFRGRVLELKDKKLGCFCKPDDCHGDVIKEYLDNETKEIQNI
jgi:hypothetical protein